MNKFTLSAALAAAVLALAGCETTNVASRDAPLGNARPGAVQPPERLGRSYVIRDIDVVVPESLRVSEANVYYPNADIVWRGDLPGDRYKQVAAIFEAGFKRGGAQLKEGIPANVKIEVARFHSLTEKTRYSFGGTHSMKFRLTLSDPQTGQVFESRMVSADLKAYGGAKALAMEAKGWGQKARITQHLANVTVRELSGKPAQG